MVFSQLSSQEKDAFFGLLDEFRIPFDHHFELFWGDSRLDLLRLLSLGTSHPVRIC